MMRMLRSNLVTITEMLDSLRKLQNVSDSSKYEKIAQVLDEDHDGVIDKAVVMEVTFLTRVNRVSKKAKLFVL